MPYLMPGRNESIVYFELTLDLTRTEPFLAEFNAAHPDTRATLFHLVLWGLTHTLHARPRLNRFVAGRKVWQRDGIWLAFAAKKAKLAEDAPLVMLKKRFEPEWDLSQVVAHVHDSVDLGRSEERSTTEKEVDWLLKLPGCGIGLLVGLARRLDAWGLWPRVMIESDPLYSSVFVANLGSLNLDAASHHLYEWGNTPIFCTIGRNSDVVAPVDGQPAVRRQGVLRFSYDERIEDGLYAQRALNTLRERLEDPAAHGALGS